VRRTLPTATGDPGNRAATQHPARWPAERQCAPAEPAGQPRRAQARRGKSGLHRARCQV